MPLSVQVGTILMTEWPAITQILGLESETCSGAWSIVKLLDNFALDRKIHAAGWNFFFMADEVSSTFFGAVGEKRIQSALKRILEKVQPWHFNALEITGIAIKSFLGVPYVTVSAHSRHVQQSCYLDGLESRQTSQNNADWATG